MPEITLTDDYPWQPAMQPVCYLCGAAPRRNEPIVRTGKYIEMEGFLLICGSCWGDGARLLGWVDPVKATKLVEDNARLKADAKIQTDAIADLVEANRVLASGILESSFKV